MFKLLSSSTAIAAAVVLSTPASAAVVIQASPSFVQPSENVLLDTDLTPGDSVLRGTTNQTASTVVFRSSTDNLASPPQGQAVITPIGTGAADGLGALTFSLQNGGTFTEAEFNVLASVGGAITLSAFDAANMLLATLSPTISTSGQNFFGFLADGATPISSIQITAAPGTSIASVGQVRVGGVNTVAGPVPEPATWAMLLFGFGFIGGMLRRRKHLVQARVNFSA